MLQFERASASEMPLAALAPSFRDWFQREPWDEYWRCPKCNVFTDFGSAGRYAEYGDGKCPQCSCGLMDYWSDERVIEYFFDAARRPGFDMIVGRDQDGIIRAWAWGYSMYPDSTHPSHRNVFYGDHVGVDQTYRGPDSLEIMNASFRLLTEVGWTDMITRTHRDTQYTHDYLTSLGFQKYEKVGEADRVYFRITMPQ